LLKHILFFFISLLNHLFRFQAELIKKLNLGGGMIWSMDLDDFKGLCGCGKYPLLRALNHGLGRGHGNATDCTWAAKSR